MKIAIIGSFTLGTLYFLNSNLNILDAKKLHKKFSTLYHNQVTHKKVAFKIMAIFFVRRLTLAVFTVWLNDHVIASLLVYFYFSIYIAGIGIHDRPLNDRWNNLLENFNESFIILSGYFIMMFSEWVGDVYVRYEYGAVYNDILQGIILLNVGMIGNNIIQSLQRYYQRRIYEIKCANAIRYKMDRIRILLKESNVVLPEEI